ncbi:MAG: hypothetical protein ACREFE_00685 [Limisphaerales bacterium]
MKIRRPFFLLLALGTLLIGAAGCASKEPSNASVRPWNAPQGWENGLPVDMGQHE